MTEEPDVVWIEAVAEDRVGYITDYTAFPRAQWEAMSDAEREQAIADAGDEAVQSIASYGAEVVDASKVPGTAKAAALAEL